MQNQNLLIDIDDDIPSNQEAISKIQDLDLTITLPESNDRVNVSTNLSEEMKLIKPILEQILVLEKRKV